MAINVKMTDIKIPYKMRHRESLILSSYALLTIDGDSTIMCHF